MSIVGDVMRKVTDLSSLKARVFISCGQSNVSETKVANDIRTMLENANYEPYVATQDHSASGLKENIFKKLSEAEYYLFIDFKREKMGTDKEGNDVHRGSLFTNQELAVASSLDLKMLGFQEEGVERQGILNEIQLNCPKFRGNEKDKLANIIHQVIINSPDWKPNWRKELAMEPSPQYKSGSKARVELTEEPQPDASDLRAMFGWAWRQAVTAIPKAKAKTAGKKTYKTNNRPARFYQIIVKNNHKDKIANNCIAYIESAQKLRPQEEEIIDYTEDKVRVELKWAGMTTFGVPIPPNTFRRFDAFYFFVDTPHEIYLAINDFIIDNTDIVLDYKLVGIGDYLLKFIVYSDTFQPCRANFILHVDQDLEKHSLKLI